MATPSEETDTHWYAGRGHMNVATKRCHWWSVRRNNKIFDRLVYNIPDVNICCLYRLIATCNKEMIVDLVGVMIWQFEATVRGCHSTKMAQILANTVNIEASEGFVEYRLMGSSLLESMVTMAHFWIDKPKLRNLFRAYVFWQDLRMLSMCTWISWLD